MKRSLTIGFVVATLLAVAVAAQRSPGAEARAAQAVRGSVLWGSLLFLADDLVEGRGTGARGGDLATRYIASQFRQLGLEPAGDTGSYYHSVPLVTMNPIPTLEVAGRALSYGDEFVAWSERAEERVSAEGELAFVGFGISASEWQWDDYRGLDVRGKVLLMLVNDPGLRDPSLFRGSTLTYYGRWTYKLEEAARQGAAAVLLLHDDTMATYGWNTVRNSWTGEQARLLRPPTSLAWAGWIQRPVANALLRERGFDLDRLMRDAARRDFRAVATGLAVRGSVRSSVRHTTVYNVVGRLPGSDPALREEAVVIGAHYDHLGIGRPVDGDSIMNGAVDNASGVATMLAVSDAFARSEVRPRRSLVFVGFAAEEQGLLGSEAFAQRPPIPPARLAAMLNLDGANLYGRTRDVAALGTDQSELGRLFEQAARAEGLAVTTDSTALLRGYFFRSDHFPLAKAGVPALSWRPGRSFVGRPAGWYEQVEAEYNRLRYHQPADQVLPWYTPDGALQQARVLVRVALRAGNAPTQPAWSAASEFRAAGEARLRPPR